MGKFEFDNDWQDRLAEHTGELARGRLPGKLGLVQDIVGHWAIPADERGWLRYGKALLDTFGSVHSYREENADERDEGQDPAMAWLTKEGYEHIYPGRAYGFGSFVRRALDGSEFKNVSVAVQDKGKGRKKRGNLVALELGEDRRVFFIPDKVTHDGTNTPSDWWAGPYGKPDEREVFAAHVRERIWGAMGSDALTISTVGGSGYSQSVELRALAADLDYTCGRDEQNDVDTLALRCAAFIRAGMDRTLLLHGPPGTGKSTLARALAKRLEVRALVVDHDTVKCLSKSAHMIIWLLRPGVLILNDVDRSENEAHRELLSALESEYTDNDNRLITCLSVNDITKLDPALLRPGRVHEVREVAEPSQETVGLILDYYIQKLSLVLTPEQRSQFLDSSHGFSPADIREFCETACAVGTEMALGEIQRIRAQRDHYAGSKCAEYNARRPTVAESCG